MQTSLAYPQRASPQRLYVYGALLAAVALLMPLFIRVWLKVDLASRNWDSFRSAGATAGTKALVDPARHMAWQAAHHHIVQVFPYPPATAWFYAPLAPLPATTGIIVNALLVSAACVLAGLLAADVFGIPKWFGVLGILAWQPAVDSMQSAQNGAVVMVAAFATMYGIVRNRPAVAGLSAGALLLKPTVGVVFIVLLLARRQWKALGVTAAISLALYVASAIAAGGDWAWPLTYVDALQTYYSLDFARNQIAAITLPAILMRAHVNVVLALGCGLALFVLALPLLVRADALAAASFAPLAGLAASPHAWGYDAALMLPAIFWAMTRMRAPLRTPVVAVSYVVALVQAPAAIVLGFNPLSILVLCASLALLISSYRAWR